MMSVLKAAKRLIGHRGCLRPCAGAAAFCLSLGAGPAAAVTISEFVWSSNTSSYNLYSETCVYVEGGRACGSNGGSKPTPGYTTPVYRSQTVIGPNDPLTSFGDGTIFNWGKGTDSDSDKALNSTLIWTNNGTAFFIDSIELSTSLSVGTDKASREVNVTPGPGQGAAPPWEWVGIDAALEPQVQNAKVGISIAGGALKPLGLFSGAGPWLSNPDYQIRHTPVTFLADYVMDDLKIDANQGINIRLFDDEWFGSGTEHRPSLLFASITVKISGRPVGAVPLPATLVLLGLGIAALRLCQCRSLPVTA